MVFNFLIVITATGSTNQELPRGASSPDWSGVTGNILQFSCFVSRPNFVIAVQAEAETKIKFKAFLSSWKNLPARAEVCPSNNAVSGKLVMAAVVKVAQFKLHNSSSCNIYTQQYSQPPSFSPPLSSPPPLSLQPPVLSVPQSWALHISLGRYNVHCTMHSGKGPYQAIRKQCHAALAHWHSHKIFFGCFKMHL